MFKTSSDSDTDMAECTSNGLFDLASSDLNHDQNDHVQKCLKSRRILEEDELLRTSKHVENDWRQLGNGFSHLQVNCELQSELQSEFWILRYRVYIF